MEDQRKLARILLETGVAVEEVTATTVTRADHGDPARQRGIPIVGRSGYGGAIPGSDPVRALLAKERGR